MAVFHASVKMVSRGEGKSLAQKAAYICGQKVFDAYCGIMRSYPRKDVVFKKVILPENAPKIYADLQTLVTEMDQSEKRRDAQTARELIFALPVEFSTDEQVQLACKSVEEFWVSRGMCALIAIHDAGKGNPHTHVLLTTRDVTGNGFSVKKNRDWNSRDLYRSWREFYANELNLKLQEKGLNIKVSHESNFVRGINEEPTRYLGAKATALQKKGILTERAAENMQIQKERRRKELEREEKRLRQKQRFWGRSR